MLDGANLASIEGHIDIFRMVGKLAEDGEAVREINNRQTSLLCKRYYLMFLGDKYEHQKQDILIS